MEMNIAMAGGVVVGYYLDKTFSTFPWLTAVFFLGGVGAGINIAVFIVKKYRSLFK